ncbi:hypothetical protein DER45DRAFT_541770 [Fusarium avenaceum]|nr:hypothetical protein DER45DRAFT_541770 [Fusarium avenaceum]
MWQWHQHHLLAIYLLPMELSQGRGDPSDGAQSLMVRGVNQITPSIFSSQDAMTKTESLVHGHIYNSPFNVPTLDFPTVSPHRRPSHMLLDCLFGTSKLLQSRVTSAPTVRSHRTKSILSLARSNPWHYCNVEAGF